MRKRLSPPQILTLGFLSIILVGALLLVLPFSCRECTFVDALFTSTSAVCVTGLIVKDTPNDFTLFGQIIIMALIQVGGFGYMTSATIFFLIIGKRIGIGERLITKEERGILDLEGIVRFIKRILIFTVLFELSGTLILTLRFLRDFDLPTAFFKGLFHAVSAFNNAGFSLFSSNLIGYRGDLVVNLTIPTLIIIGGIGYVVINELYMYIKKEVNRISQHTKIVLLATAILIVGGAVLIYLFEISNPKTFASMPLQERIFASYFSSVTPRTAGFNVVDYSLLRPETLFLTILLMFIGASPGGTGGGVKTSSVAIIVASLLTTIRGRQDVVIFHRRVPPLTVAKSYLVVTLASALCATSTLSLVLSQGMEYLPTMFEVTSAFGTVGLSVGDGGVRSLAALFSDLGKLTISLTMFIGRLGPLTLAFAVTRQEIERYRYPEGRVMIG